MFSFNHREIQQPSFDNAEVSLNLRVKYKQFVVYIFCDINTFHIPHGIMPRQLQLSSHLKDLKPTHLSKLSQILDPGNVWKDFAARIKRRNGSDMFNIDQINLLESTTLRTGESPTKTILISWCTANPTIEDLRSVLKSIDNIRAVSYVDTCIISGEATEATTKCNHHDDTDLVDGTDSSTYKITSERSTQAQNRQTGKPEKFSYRFLQQVTDDFNSMFLSEGGRLIGKGGFADVFKGSHPDYPDMAVKRFNEAYTNDSSLVERQFSTELKTLFHCQHENILPLIGHCREDNRLCVVSEYMVNGSLEDRLACKDGAPSLQVAVRLSIIKGVARGLEYLHMLDPPLIHRDIKTANILLDEKFTAKIGDCGTVRRGPDGTKTSTLTDVAIGTSPYMPTEYLYDLKVSVKTDAYSFGVVLLETLTGLPVMDDNRENKYLPTHIYEILEDDDDGILDLVDKKAGNWGQLPKVIYQLSKKLRENKTKRLTVIEALPEIERWEQLLDSI